MLRTRTQLIKSELRAYLKGDLTSRAFYVPAWADGVVGQCCVADLLRPVAVDKRVLASGKAKVLARLTRAPGS